MWLEFIRKKKYNFRIFSIAALILLFFICGLKAEQSANKKEIKITADRLVSEGTSNYIEFQGNVKVVNDQTIITSNKLKIFYNSSKDDKKKSRVNESIEKIIASGEVKIVFKENIAYTKKAEYSLSDKLIILTGNNTRVLKGKNSISGDKITLNLEEEDFKVETQGPKQVEAFFYEDIEN